MANEPQIIYDSENYPVIRVGYYPVILPELTGWEWRLTSGPKEHMRSRSTILKSQIDVHRHLLSWMKGIGCEYAIVTKHSEPARD